jgi:hypothetical protein
MVIRELTQTQSNLSTLLRNALTSPAWIAQWAKTRDITTLSMVIASQPSPPQNREASQLLGTLMADITPADPTYSHGIAMGVLYRLYGQTSPDYFQTIMTPFSKSLTTPFCRGFQVISTPLVIDCPPTYAQIPTGDALTAYLTEPVPHPGVMRERAQDITRWFEPAPIRYRLILNGKITRDRIVKIISGFPLDPNGPTMDIRTDANRPIVLFSKRPIAPTSISPTDAHWKLGPTRATLWIPLPQVTGHYRPTVAIPVMTGLTALNMEIDGETVTPFYSEGWIYIQSDKSSKLLRIDYLVPFKGQRSAVVAWIQSGMQRHYIRIPGVTID